MPLNHAPKSPSCPRSMNVGHLQTQSDTNLPSLVQEDDLSTLDKRSTKRQRTNSPLNPNENMKEDSFSGLKDMLLSFQKERILKTLVTDIHGIKSSKNEQSMILNQLISDISEVKQQNCQIQKTNELDKKKL